MNEDELFEFYLRMVKKNKIRWSDIPSEYIRIKIHEYMQNNKQ